MEELITKVWDWLGDKDHRERLLALVAVLGLARIIRTGSDFGVAGVV